MALASLMLNVSQASLELFHRDLWKDSRHLEVIEVDGKKRIRRFADGNVPISKELGFITWIQERVSFKVPEIVQASDGCLIFEYIEGTRAFNLLMDLRALYRLENNCLYRDLARQLLQLLMDDLRSFQQAADTTEVTNNLPIYPVTEKLRALYQVLSGVLPDTCAFNEVEADLDRIAAVYRRHAQVPFRDATPKNVILKLPLLFQSRFKSRIERLEAVRQLCVSGEMAALLVHDNVYHIDFSGCHLLCPEADDWVALMEHESSVWLMSAQRPVSPDLEVPDLCTRFVRFSRFAGRKLAYRLLNRCGHEIRFALDHEAGYFLTLSNITRYLQALQVIDGRKLTGMMEDLFRATSLVPEKDYLQEMLPAGSLRTYYSDVFPG